MSTYARDVLEVILDYNPNTGVFIWKRRTADLFSASNPVRACNIWNTRHAGKIAFTTESRGGYLTTTIFNKRLMAHRAAWCLGSRQDIQEDMLVDHINGNTQDNRLVNLRLSTATQNVQNAKLKKDDFRGAFFHKSSKKWQAAIRLHLGTYETELEAAQAYETAARELHGKFYLPNGKRVNVVRVL
jgi:hypothetical protein